MRASSEKIKMKKSYSILVSATDILKKFLPLPKFFGTLSFPLKKEWEGVKDTLFSSKNLCNIRLKSFRVFLLEYIRDVFWVFLQLPAIRNKTIIQN